MSNLDYDLTSLNLDKSIIRLLKNYNINSINDLWIKTRKSLKSMGLADNQIKIIRL